MKKIAAFLTALMIFFGIVVAFHFFLSSNIKTNNKEFGTWVSLYKDYSCKAVTDNINDDTMLVLGSSEFYHGLKTKYHPANLFKKQNIDLMIIGGAYSQSLNQTIKLGAVEKNLKKRKAVFLLSPTWFYKQGVTKESYAAKFSESDYMAFMENENISKDIKKYVAKRSEELLGKDQTMKNRVERYDKMFVDGDVNIVDKIFYTVRKTFITDKEIISIKTAMWENGIKAKREPEAKIKNPPKLDWKTLTYSAVTEAKEKTSNQFYMIDSAFNKSFKKRMKIAKESHKNTSFESSPEYEDLECFLKVCKERNIEPLIILQPMNGYWYDYTGLTEAKRQVYKEKVVHVINQYDAKVADFTGEDYSKYFLEDAVHPGGEGWVKINEKIYDYYNEK